MSFLNPVFISSTLPMRKVEEYVKTINPDNKVYCLGRKKVTVGDNDIMLELSSRNVLDNTTYYYVRPTNKHYVYKYVVPSNAFKGEEYVYSIVRKNNVNNIYKTYDCFSDLVKFLNRSHRVEAFCLLVDNKLYDWEIVSHTHSTPTRKDIINLRNNLGIGERISELVDLFAVY